MNKFQVSYTVQHGIGHYFHEELVKDVRQAVCYTIGTDSAGWFDEA